MLVNPAAITRSAMEVSTPAAGTLICNTGSVLMISDTTLLYDRKTVTGNMPDSRILYTSFYILQFIRSEAKTLLKG